MHLACGLDLSCYGAGRSRGHPCGRRREPHWRGVCGCPPSPEGRGGEVLQLVIRFHDVFHPNLQNDLADDLIISAETGRRRGCVTERHRVERTVGHRGVARLNLSRSALAALPFCFTHTLHDGFPVLHVAFPAARRILRATPPQKIRLAGYWHRFVLSLGHSSPPPGRPPPGHHNFHPHTRPHTTVSTPPTVSARRPLLPCPRFNRRGEENWFGESL